MKYIVTILVFVILVSMSLGDKMFAFAVLDINGTFSCNPNDMSLEKASYKHVVGFINSAISIDKKLISDISEQQLHDNLMDAKGATGHNTVDFYNQERQCLSNNGVDPNSVAILSDEATMALNYGTTIPEFSSVVGLVTVVAIMSGILVTRKF